MSGAIRFWTIVMIGAGSVFTGGVVWYAWERVWIWRRLTLEEYAIDFRRSLRKADPALPILLMVCGVSAGAFAVLSNGPARTWALAGIGMLTVILIGSLVLAEPINNQFRRRAEGVVPEDAEHLRRFWRRFHMIRTALAVPAFLCLVTAVTYA